MLKLQTSLIWPGCAQGKYIVKAKGFFLAVLYWGDEHEPLRNWGPFAYVPIDPVGNGSFFFSGKRSIPPVATHVWARCYSSDFTKHEDIAVEIPTRYLQPDTCKKEQQRFSILTDLHLSSKPWKIRQALTATESNKILLLGDAANDGLQEQFSVFEKCIEESVPEKIIFSVTGNHDVLHPSRDDYSDGCGNYQEFQNYLLMRAKNAGYNILHDTESRAYAVQIGNVDIIGIQCVMTGRKFRFPEGKQIDWLEGHLSSTEASWHVILCHAPLLKHNPNRETGTPYLDNDRRLQEIVDRSGRIIFLSGHTHVSPNVLPGNGEFDEVNQNIYLDCGSVVSTDTSNEKGLMSSEWKDGCKTELMITSNEVEIVMSSVESGIIFPRGYYRYMTKQIS